MRAADRRWYVLSLLTAAYACHSMDRSIIAVAIEPIKHEFGVSDSAMGFVSGLGYAIAFSAACLPVGMIADRVVRKSLFGALLAIWSGLTALCGAAPNYLLLLLSRMGVGAAEAGAQPICLSLISDLFRPNERSTAIGVFYVSTGLGISASFLLGGLIAAHFGWRATFLAAGVPGLALGGLIFFTVREPVRGALEAASAGAASLSAFVGHVRRSPGLTHIALGMTLASFAAAAMWIWAVSLLVRLHHLPLGKAGAIVAAGSLAQAVGAGVAGRLGDRVAGGRLRDLLIVPIGGTLLCVPLGVALAYAPSLPLAFAFLALTAFAAGFYLAPSFAVVMSLTPPGMRGVAAAALQMIINLLGSGVGPFLLGVLSDAFGGQDSLRPAFAIVMLVNAWGALHLWLGRRRVSPDALAHAAAVPAH